MCGNGARCSVQFAKNKIIVSETTSFNAYDGGHYASIDQNTISLSMSPVTEIKNYNEDLFLDTGSPHFVKIVDNLSDYNVFENGKKNRNSSSFAENGVNVNFVEQISEDEFSVRTYERGERMKHYLVEQVLLLWQFQCFILEKQIQITLKFPPKEVI